MKLTPRLLLREPKTVASKYSRQSIRALFFGSVGYNDEPAALEFTKYDKIARDSVTAKPLSTNVGIVCWGFSFRYHS